MYQLMYCIYFYRGVNCPDRHPSTEQTNSDTDKAGFEMILELEFIFLSIVIIATFFASVFICGALFTNKGVRRPFNQVSAFSLLCLF